MIPTAVRLSALISALLALAACAHPPRTVKIALIAPFEGRARQLGYDAFPALRLALRERMVRTSGGSLQIEFVAYDDGADPVKAERVARNAVRDPDVLAVIGHLTLTPTLRALPVYRQARIPVLVPHLAPESVPQDPWVFCMGPAAAARGADGREAPDPQSLPAAAQALERFQELSLGPPPSAGSIVAYDAAGVLLSAIDAAHRAGQLDRAGVAAALRTGAHRGLLGEIRFDATNRWADAPVFRK
jgi:ABC-type branched-subunit amino acid transport system substrate-binding protein